MQEWISWLILVILLSLIELMTINLTTIWFVISSTIALIISIFIDNFIIQFSIFVIVGVILLLTLKPMFIKYIKNHQKEINKDKVKVKKSKNK